MASGAPAVERHLLRRVSQSAEDYELFAENAGDGCGASAFVGHVERLCFERQMQLALVGAGGIGVASHALCAVYFDSTDQPYEDGIVLTDPPVCDRCIDSRDSITKLEQHASVLKEVPQTSLKALRHEDEAARASTQPAAEMCNRRATVQATLQEKHTPKPQNPPQNTRQSRPLPAWMSLLPSNVNPHIKPPSHLIISRRMSFPSYSSSSNPTPYVTPLEWPINHDDHVSKRFPTPLSLSLDGDSISHASEEQKRHSSADFASLLGHTQELFYLPSSNAAMPKARPSEREEAPAKNPAFNLPTEIGSITIPTSPSFKSTFSATHPRTPYGTSPRATSSEAKFPLSNRPTPVAKHTPLPPIPSSSFTSSHPATNPFSNLRASSLETSIPTLSTPKAHTSGNRPFPPENHGSTAPRNLPRKNSKVDDKGRPSMRAISLPTTPTPSRPPFLRELSSFFASRSVTMGSGNEAKLILPSRAMEGRGVVPPRIRLRMRAEKSQCCGECGTKLDCGKEDGCWDGSGGDGTGSGNEMEKPGVEEKIGLALPVLIEKDKRDMLEGLY